MELNAHIGAVVAAAAVLVAIVAIAGALLARRRASATRAPGQVSESAVADLERAFIVVEGITSDTRTFIGPDAAWDTETQGPSFSFAIVNVGRSVGHIEDAAIVFEVLDRIPDEITGLQIAEGDSEAVSAEIVVGPDRSFHFPALKCRHEFTAAHAQRMRDETAALYCHGLLTYRDAFRTIHTTRFCQKYAPGLDDWAPAGGKERNSSD